jgi:D-3-phosphoglycerate dehydrogenase
MKIFISDAFDASLPERLSKFGEVTDDKNQLPDAEIVLIRSKTKCTKEYIDGAPKLKYIIRGGVGLDNVDRDYAKQKGILVSNTAEASAIAVAELAFAMMISMPSNLFPGNESMKKGEWIKKQLKRTELYGKTLGLLGVGNIGTEVAKRAKAFGMTVLAYDPYVSSHEFAEMVTDLNDFISKCDFISLHMPLTDDTKGMCVVEDDVAAALESGKIKGYATDVWYSDPPENTPLTKAPNTVCLPHIGASTKENLLRIGDVIDRLIGEYVKSK